MLYRKYRNKVVLPSILQPQIQKYKYSINLTFISKYNISQKPYLFVWFRYFTYVVLNYTVYILT